MNGRQKYAWQDSGRVLSHFGDTVRKARKRYNAFVAQGLIDGASVDYDGGGLTRSVGGKHQLAVLRQEKNRRLNDERILGSGDFLAEMLRKLEDREGQTQLMSLPSLVESVCRWYWCNEYNVRFCYRKNPRNWNQKSYWCKEKIDSYSIFI